MKKKIIVTGIILFCLVSLIVFLCVKNINKSNEQSSNSNNFKIVTSFYPMYIIAENLTKNAQNIELSNMAEVNGGCLHDYTLSTNDVKKFENADVFIENGVGIENFTEKLLQVYSNLKVIDSSTGITDIINDEEGENGHIWTSMENYKKQVKNIANNLAKYNTENAEIYNRNADEYIEKIEELNRNYKEELSSLSGKKAICLNEAFSYLARDLNLDIIMVETDHEESTLSADKLKELIGKKEEQQEGNDKKKIENLVFLIILSIITIVIINIIWNGNKKEDKKETDSNSKQLATTNQITNDSKNNVQLTDNLEEKLENILGKIQGVGAVKVCINYSESSEVVAMYNESSKVSNTEESDTSGGTRKIQETDSQKDIIYKEENGEKTPITQKVVQPKIEGAIITAKGANNADTKANIIQAVEAVTGLATHKIQVFEMNG